MVKKIKDPGLGYNSSSDAQSIIRKNGALNILIKNLMLMMFILIL